MEKPQVSPEESANWLSRLTFWWLATLMNKGSEKPLDPEDLPPLPTWDEAKSVSSKFSSEWDKEKKAKTEPNVTKVLIQSFRHRLWVGGVLQFVTVLLQATPPIFLNSILLYIQGDPSGNFMYIIFGEYFGYYAAAAMFVVPAVQSLVEAQFNQVMFRVAMHVKTTLIKAIYAKSMRLSNSMRQSRSVGEIITLMQVDTEEVSMATWYLHNTWSTVLQALLNLAMLIYFIGWSALPGFSLLLITIPTQSKLVSLLVKTQRNVILNTGKRMKVVHEILRGMRVLKYYAWEVPYSRIVGSIRERELKAIHARMWLRAAQLSLTLATPTLIAVVIFAFYSGIAKEDMTAAVVFTALAVINSLRVPLKAYPIVVNYMLSGYVSLHRINNFLNVAELKPVFRDENGLYNPVALAISDCNFSWAPELLKGASSMKGRGNVHSVEVDRDSSSCTMDGLHCGTTPTPDVIQSHDNECAPELSDHAKAGDICTKTDRHDNRGTLERRGKPFELQGINISVARGELFAVLGSIGSGKTALISALLGEMEISNGEVSDQDKKSLEEKPDLNVNCGGDRESLVRINGTVSYCNQQAWIMHATLRENILFGCEYNEERYAAVIEACALLPDIKAFPDGDFTEIGERGLNLSGGQRQRVSLARAAYADTDIVLLDDPLSAVDAQVSAHVFEKCINGFIRGRTRILVTNQLKHAPAADSIIVLSSGSIAEQGTYQKLLSQGGELARLTAQGAHPCSSDSPSERGEGMVGCNYSVQASNFPLNYPFLYSQQPFPLKGKLVELEKRVQGMLSLDVYWKYWTETSKIMALGVLGSYAVVQAIDAASVFWLAFWTADQFHQSQAFYLAVFALLAVAQSGSLYLCTSGQALLGLWAAKKLHSGMLASVLRAPMSFFDAVPVGRILNRFSADQAGVDEMLPSSWSTSLNIIFSVFGTVIMMSVIMPSFIPVFLIVACIYFYLQQFYQETVRELKRLEAVSRSPVHQQFTETLNGLPVIRAYGQEERFLQACDSKLDSSNCTTILLNSCDRWLTIRLEILGNALVCAIAILAVSQKGTIFAGLAGVAIGYALLITASLSTMVRYMAHTENQMSGVERILEYRDKIPHEAPAVIADKRPEDMWPKRGCIEVHGLSMRYRPNLPLVLKQVSFSIAGGERIGVVGRTGSGKSSLMLCLFRLVEPAEGRICIDGVDISTIGLHDLRSRLSVIPQDPVLFSGTVRSNLDPLRMHSDHDLWEALQHAHLKEKVLNLPQKLEAEVVEYGDNFSLGERQLLCVARVLLRRCRILIMDEATSSVDFKTDRHIQNAIQTYVSAATTKITIAHRMNTVKGSSRVLVLSDGKVAEFGRPSFLLKDPNGKFTSLFQDGG